MKNIFKSSIRFFTKAGVVATVLSMTLLPAISFAETLNRSLTVGSTGSDVSSLQSFLAQDVTLYPQGLVTGYYGFFTKAAVSNFQIRNGISAVGVVGPITLPVLNFQIAQGVNGKNMSAPIITSVNIGAGKNNVNVGWNTNEFARGQVYFNTSPLALYESLHDVTVSGGYSAMTDNGMRTSQNVALQNLQADTTYYYMIYTSDQDGNVSITWPSTFRTTN